MFDKDGLSRAHNCKQLWEAYGREKRVRRVYSGCCFCWTEMSESTAYIHGVADLICQWNIRDS
jgi:hypothetical protein